MQKEENTRRVATGGILNLDYKWTTAVIAVNSY